MNLGEEMAKKALEKGKELEAKATALAEKAEKTGKELQQKAEQIQQQAEQAKQQTIQMEYQMKSELEKVKAEMQARLIELSGQFDLERERIAASGRVESSYVQATERQDSNVRDNKAKLIKEDKQNDVPQIDIKANLESRVAPETEGGKQLGLDIQGFNFANNEEEQMPQDQMMQEQMMQDEMMQEMPEEEAMGEMNLEQDKMAQLAQYMQNAQSEEE